MERRGLSFRETFVRATRAAPTPIVAWVAVPCFKRMWCSRVRGAPILPRVSSCPNVRIPVPDSNLRRLGSSELLVHPLCLGGNTFGWTTDRDESFAVLDSVRRGGRQLHRHGRLLLVLDRRAPRWRIGDDHRRVARAGPAPRRPHRGDEGGQRGGGRAARARTEAGHRRLRGVAQAPRSRAHRSVLRPSRRPLDAARGDARRVRRARARGQGGAHRRVQLLRRRACARPSRSARSTASRRSPRSSPG